MTTTKTSAGELAKQVTKAVLDAIARGEDNLAIYQAVESALSSPSPIREGLKQEFEIIRTASRLFEDVVNTWMERAIKTEVVLKYYEDLYCEGWCKDTGGSFEDCGGCKARTTLAQQPKGK